MKTRTPRFIVLASTLALFAVASELSAAGFQKFVTVGDSLIAGEESGCVVQRFQERSWVALAAKALGQSDFQQPFISEVPATSPLTGYPCLGPDFNGTSFSLKIVSETGENINLLLPRPYDNLGFNGSPLIDDFVNLKVTVPGRSDLDNLAGRVLRNCEGCPFQGMSAVDEANALQPDLVAFWGGNNDVLNAMLAGGAIPGVTITPPDAFANSYNQVVSALSAPGRTLVVFNIPDVRAIPFATTVPPFVVNPATRQPVILNGQPVPLLGPGDAAFPCTPTPPDQGCPLPAGSLVTLQALLLLPTGMGIPVALGGSGQPLPHATFTPPATLTPGVVLYPDDLQLIESSTDAYNAAISAAANANGAILIDANALFSDAAAHGFEIGGIHLTTSFLTGGLFSYDGVHPSAIGYGIIADVFIQTLNAAAQTNYPRPNFSEILFTPNVPNLAGGSVSAPPAYDFSLWRNALGSAVFPRWFEMRMPAPDPGPLGRTTRTLTRTSD